MSFSKSLFEIRILCTPPHMPPVMRILVISFVGARQLSWQRGVAPSTRSRSEGGVSAACAAAKMRVLTTSIAILRTWQLLSVYLSR